MIPVIGVSSIMIGIMLFMIIWSLQDIHKALGHIAGEIQSLRLTTHVFRQGTPENWPPRSD